MVKLNHRIFSEQKCWRKFQQLNDSIPCNELWLRTINERLERYGARFFINEGLEFETEEGMTLFVLEWS